MRSWLNPRHLRCLDAGCRNNRRPLPNELTRARNAGRQRMRSDAWCLGSGPWSVLGRRSWFRVLPIPPPFLCRQRTCFRATRSCSVRSMATAPRPGVPRADVGGQLCGDHRTRHRLSDSAQRRLPNLENNEQPRRRSARNLPSWEFGLYYVPVGYCTNSEPFLSREPVTGAGVR
jgi:hypothetical protein